MLDSLLLDSLALADSLSEVHSFNWRHLPWMLAVLPLSVVLAASLFTDRVSTAWRRWIVLLALGLCGMFFALDLLVIGKNIDEPRDWDFKGFWFWSVALAEGTNPYDHANLLRIAEPLQPSEELQREIRCVYPPPSLLLFAPLGWFDFRTALILWSIFQLGVFVSCALLMVRWFRPRPTWEGGVTIAALFLCYWGTSATLSFLQTNHLVLLALLLFWRDRDRPIAGVWLVLGALAKPVAAPVGLYLLVRGRWKAVGVSLLTAGAALLATWLAFGSELFTQFFNSDGVGEHYLIAQTINQSLSAVLLRATATQATASSLLTNPLILVATLSLIALSSFVIYHLRGPADRHALGLAIATALISYPATLTHYAVLMLIPLALIVADPPRAPLHRWGVVAAVALFFLLSAFKLTFPAMLIAWLIVALCGMEVLSREASVPENKSPELALARP